MLEDNEGSLINLERCEAVDRSGSEFNDFGIAEVLRYSNFHRHAQLWRRVITGGR